MGTVTFDTFYPSVLPYVHDCPAPVALNAVRNACIEFCRQTMFWQIDIPATTLPAQQNTYPLTSYLPAQTDLVQVVTAWFGQQTLQPKSADELNQIYGPYVWNTEVGWPHFFTQEIPTDIIIVPSPDTPTAAQNTFSARVCVAPTRAATSVYDQVYERYNETISHGARARLYGMLGQPFYNEGLAQEYRRYFVLALGEAKAMTNKSLTRTSSRIRNVRWT